MCKKNLSFVAKVPNLVWVEENVGGGVDGQEEVVHFDEHHHPGRVHPLSVPHHLGYEVKYDLSKTVSF